MSIASAAALGHGLLACDSQALSSAGAGGRAGTASAAAAGNSGSVSSGSSASGGAAAPGISVLPGSRTNVFAAMVAAGGSSPGGSDGSSSGADSGANSGSAGTGPEILGCTPSAPPGSPPASALCGDGFWASSEACDDDNTDAGDSCSSSCQVTPELVDARTSSSSLPLAGRSLGASRHPLAAGCNTVALAFTEQTSLPEALKLSTFTSSGKPLSTVQFGTSAVDSPDPAVAPLPDGSFAVAWTDFGSDGDVLGVQLAHVDPSAGAAREPAVVASEQTSFSQSAPDLVFDGRELVLAWVDSSNPSTAPDLRYRLFDTSLKPLTDELSLAATNAVEDDVALATFNGQWAAAWRSGDGGSETIEVQSGSVHWTVGPFLPGLDGDRPDLIFLDASHLALAFTKGTDPDGTGVANVSRLHGAILDTSAPGQAASFEIPAAQDPYASMPSVAQTQPSLALLPGRLLVGWHSAAVPGDARGEELWLRRIPFTVGSDHSITIDASHVEVPLIVGSAQRSGDQSAFRMLTTNLWPSGGVVAAWDDQARTFPNAAGAPEVALQFFPDLAEPPPAVGQYPVSADGKYYVVNLLKRNYPGPTAASVYANGAIANNFDPLPYLYDGSAFPYSWNTPTANDPDATAVITVDMGQYFDVGAIRTYYLASTALPVTHQIRLSSDLINWQTVVPTQPTPADATYSFDHVTARFLELTQVGTQANSAARLSELFVFPSTHSAPPTAADGYDLGSLSTTNTVNANMWAPGVKLPAIWPAGSFLPKRTTEGATGDAVGTVDLGAQYPVSRASICFNLPSSWTNGGRLDIAAIPDAYEAIFDSGVGHPFGLVDACQELFFAPQPARYIRATDYFISGTGPSLGGLAALQSFTTPAPRTAYYPLSADGNFFNVNLLRGPASAIQPTVSVVYADGALAYTPNPPYDAPANIFDGDDFPFEWWTPPAATPGATATLTIDLGQVVSMGAIRQIYASLPLSFSLRLAQTLGGWVQAIPDTAVSTNDVISSFTSTSARYLEFTIKGTGAAKIVGLNELAVFPPSTVDPAPSSGSRLDLAYLPGVTVTPNANMSLGGRPYSHISQTDWYNKTTADGGTGDATLTVDLGQQYQISQINLDFYLNNTWAAGGKVEVDDGSGNWSTVSDSGRGTPLGSANNGPRSISFSARPARRIRLTAYFTQTRGIMENIEVF